jgi:GNAT superfamily N-acetyltransferase
MRVRHATPDDAAAIERIRVDTWRATYRGLMPDVLMDRLEPVPDRRLRTMSMMPPDQFALVAEDDGTVIGYCFGGRGRSDTERYPGEVYAIYVWPLFQGRGAGRAMLTTATEELVRRGWNAMLIWVLRENAPARGFYERMGGSFFRDEEREIDGVRITESGYGWADISRSFGGSSGRTQRM